MFSTVTLGLCLAILFSHAVPASSSCKRISAAFAYDYITYFIIEDKIYPVDRRGNEMPVMDVSSLGFDHTITAAFDVEQWDNVYLLGGFKEMGLHRMADEIEPFMDNLKDVFDVGETCLVAVDAAVVQKTPFHYSDQAIYFSGKFHVNVDLDWKDTSKMIKNSDVGLPCNVDAAVLSSAIGALVVIKGDSFWFYNSEPDDTKGPFKLSKFLPLFDKIKLCPFEQ